MTIKEALKTKSENLTVSDGKLNLVLLESNLSGTDTYNPDANEKAVDMAYLTLLLESISVSEIREDDVAIKYTNNLKEIVSAICKKWGLPDPYAVAKPSVKQVQIF
ncbi:hypothetical protein DBR40_05305 [Pedobacter sp. KBW01]|uniref:DUF6706 family protein n=1 Tax=Pedobacter sp. KBW01 TaxID=2153364 RepID=UPI000F5ACE1C|nr:DUF6706 family protein [Pedobacter sp. KBW01]RQO79138.1 hypothetical protein DBR40_05305 [Pedobacter sp. KBW01]